MCCMRFSDSTDPPMEDTYKIRFISSGTFTLCGPSSAASSHPIHGGETRRKSHGGCRECKRRRVKCDERYPVCTRCQRRGSICIMGPKKNTWQIEHPGLTMAEAPNYNLSLGSHVDTRLLRLWLERTSQIMVLDPERNPLSHPILALLDTSPWLASVLQSISAAYENDFDPSKSTVCFTHKGRALRELSLQVASFSPPLAPMIIGIFLLGVSSSWMEADPCQFGNTHLLGGRTVFDLLVAKSNANREPMEWFAIGTYVYWDMSCSWLVDPMQQKPMNTSKIHAAVTAMRDIYHPMAGYATELYYILGNLGRYCRRVVSLGEKDEILESTIDYQLQNWRYPMVETDNELLWQSEAFRMYGLILLYRGCRARPSLHSNAGACEIDALIHDIALNTVRILSRIPISSSHFLFQPIPLLGAGSELWDTDVKEREEVVRRFKALFSVNRAPVNLFALQLLKETWTSQKYGNTISWIELMLEKNWRFTMG